MEGVGIAPCTTSTRVRAGAPLQASALDLCNRDSATSKHVHPPVDTIDLKRRLSFVLRQDAYPCTSGSWTQLSIGLLNHGAWARIPAYLWVIGFTACGDKDTAALAIIWSKNLQVYGCFLSP